MIIPPYLKKGDTIGITCPAGALTLDTIADMRKQLAAWGFQVKIGKTVGTSFHKYSAPDNERLADLQNMLDDDNINAILFGRGGYGLVRIIDRIDFSKFIQKPKWILGFSDVTCLLSQIHTQYDIATIHGHMSGGYHADGFDAASTQSIFDALTGKLSSYKLSEHPMNRPGDANGVLIGGNLALISDVLGTPSDIDTTRKILFLEDIGEYKYSVDRMMWQLKRAGKLENLQALLVGGFTGCLDNETEFGMTEDEIIWEKVKDYNYPVYFDFPVGHQSRNVALKIGVKYKIEDGLLYEVVEI